MDLIRVILSGNGESATAIITIDDYISLYSPKNAVHNNVFIWIVIENSDETHYIINPDKYDQVDQLKSKHYIYFANHAMSFYNMIKRDKLISDIVYGI